MNTPTFEYAFQRRARRARTVRRLLPAALTAGTILAAGCVAVRAADGDIPPTAIHAAGICQGLRAAGSIDARRPIVVFAVRPGGETAEFRCDPVSDGKWLAPVARTVRWQF